MLKEKYAAIFPAQDLRKVMDHVKWHAVVFRGKGYVLIKPLKERKEIVSLPEVVK